MRPARVAEPVSEVARRHRSGPPGNLADRGERSELGTCQVQVPTYLRHDQGRLPGVVQVLDGMANDDGAGHHSAASHQLLFCICGGGCFHGHTWNT